MSRVRRRFGVMFWITVFAALATLASMPFWSVAMEQWQAWTLSSRLKDSSATVRKEAADGLVQLGPGATSWVIRALRDPDVKVRLLACAILPRTDPDHALPALDALVAALQDSDATVREAAANQLSLASGTLGEKAGAEVLGRVIVALRAALDDPVKNVRIAAALALASFGSSAKSAVGDLDRMLANTDPTSRVFAARSLLRIDPGGSRDRVIATLVAMLNDPKVGFERTTVIRHSDRRRARMRRRRS